MTKKMAAFGGLVTVHWVEHLVQAYQVWVLGLPRHMAGGLMGTAFPWLMHSEWLHWGFAFFMQVGFVALQEETFPLQSQTLWHNGVQLRKVWYPMPGAGWWLLATVLQTWHLFEHSILLVQALQGVPVPVSLIQHIFPRIELHLFYNTLVTVPMLLALRARSLFKTLKVDQNVYLA